MAGRNALPDTPPMADTFRDFTAAAHVILSIAIHRFDLALLTGGHISLAHPGKDTCRATSASSYLRHQTHTSGRLSAAHESGALGRKGGSSKVGWSYGQLTSEPLDLLPSWQLRKVASCAVASLASLAAGPKVGPSFSCVPSHSLRGHFQKPLES